VSFVPLFSSILEELGEQTTGATVIMTALTASVNFTGEKIFSHLRPICPIDLEQPSYSVAFYLAFLLEIREI
jgi:hypothetical protein